MSIERHGIERVALALALAASACGTPDDRPSSEEGVLTGLPPGGTTLGSSSGEAGTEAGVTTDGPTDTADDGSGGGLKLDVGPQGTTGGACPPDDACCTMEIPPHELLDAFLLAYPPPNMPKSVAEIQAFMPQADGHMMAWSDENVGDEIIDATNGGVIEANIETGRDIARAAAEQAIPAGGMVIEVREDPVIIEDLGGAGVCLGVGWGWGSLLFEDVDGSIGELVYLYIGYCADGDIEVFYYSDQAVQICEPPA